MKILKSLLITFIALLLTGCYTQLQYSQKMKKITDKQEVKQNAPSGQEQTPEESTEEYAEGEEDYVPLYYKDYDYVRKYSDCNCNPYNVYNFYGSPYDWYAYDFYRPYYSYRSYLSLHHSFFFNDWYHRHHFGYPRFSITFGWGSPYYHSLYHHPYYYGYGFSPFAYNYHRFYGSFGYGYYYGGQKVRDNRRDDVSYGPRSIGTNRVTSSSGDQTVRRDNSRAAVNSSSAARTRSVGTTRSQDTASRNSGTVNRTREQSNTRTKSTNTRTRSRDNNQSDRNNNGVYIDRTDESLPVLIDRERYNAIRARAAAASSSRNSLDNNDNRDLRKVRVVNLNNSERKGPTFFQRMKEAFQSTGRIISNSSRSSGSTVRSRSTSSSSRSTISRTKSSSSRSSVSRSKSSSSNSRSRGGSSSSSRSRSGDSGSSGSDRSRGN